MEVVSQSPVAAADPTTTGEGKKGRKRGKRAGKKNASPAAEGGAAAASPAKAAAASPAAAKAAASPKNAKAAAPATSPAKAAAAKPQQAKGEAKPKAAPAAAAAPAKKGNNQPNKPQQQQKPAGQQKGKGGNNNQQKKADKPAAAAPAAPAAANGKKGGKKANNNNKAVAQPEQKKAKVEVAPEEEAATNQVLEAALKEADEVQVGLEQLGEEEARAVQVIQREYNGKRKAHFVKRKAALDKIPEFWLTAFANTPAVGLLTEADYPILKFWKDLNCVETTDDAADKDKHADDFKLVFTFNKNPYFQNKQVWKEFKYTDDGDVTTVASPIQWNKGKCPFEKAAAAEKAADDKAVEKTKNKRVIDEDDESEPSFFEWFKSDETDADLGEFIRDALWGNPIKYYLGEASDDEDDSFMDFDDDDSEEDGEDGLDGEEEDNENGDE